MSEQANIVMDMITCPNCAAQYQIAPGTIGANGRSVQCAQCQKSWTAKVEKPPEPAPSPSEIQKEVDEAIEKDLDKAFVENQADSTSAEFSDAKEKEESNNKQSVDPDLLAKKRKDMAQRQSQFNRSMPRAKLKRAVRFGGALILGAFVFGGVFLRENVVLSFPDLAGIYSAIGLGVNVTGLEFSDVKTLRFLRDGAEVMDISAGITSVSSHQVSVPPVIVTLLDQDGRSVFEWSVKAQVLVMMPGEWIEFKTQLVAPPKESQIVRLTFESRK